MRRFLTGLLLALGLTTAHASVGGFLYEHNRAFEAWLAGLDEHRLTVNGVSWHYYARHTERAETCLVLVHGFTAEAANWFRFALRLDRDRCLIVPDLPGFGESDYRPQLSFRIPAQTARLKDFLAVVKPGGRFDLAGSSMGGHIALRYALEYPGQVRSLALFDAGGITSPQPSDNSRQIAANGRNSFDIRRREDFEPFLHMGMHQVPWMPGVVKDHLADQFIARNGRYMAIFAQIYQQDLEDARVASLTLPTLIVWGDQDRLLHVSMATAFQRAIRGSRRVEMPGIGHLPFLEAPGKTAAIYEDFRGKLDERLTRTQSVDKQSTGSP
jgi:abhydrolase domain-containing protein 6